MASIAAQPGWRSLVVPAARYRAARELCRRRSPDLFFASYFISRPRRYALFALDALRHQLDDILGQPQPSTIAVGTTCYVPPGGDCSTSAARQTSAGRAPGANESAAAGQACEAKQGGVTDHCHGAQGKACTVAGCTAATAAACTMKPATACATAGCSGGACSGETIEMRRTVCVAVIDHLDSGLETGKPELDAYLDVKGACALPRSALERWIEASAMERALPRCATWKKLSDLFAGGVGSAATLAATALMPDGTGASSLSDTLTGQVHAFAAAIGLIRVIENIGEDWKLGRLLLPLDDLVKFSLSERDIARFAEASTTAGDDRWQKLMQFEADRIRNLFRGGSRALSVLADDGCRRAAAVVGVIAMNRLERLLQKGGDPFQTRVTTSAWRRLACMPRAARLAVDPAAAARVF